MNPEGGRRVVEMLKTFRLWKKFAVARIAEDFQYAEDFFLGIFALVLTNVIGVLFYWVIMQNIPNINGWTLEELLFLYALEVFAWGVWNTFLKGTVPWRVEEAVRSGSLDRVLVQPMKPIKYMMISTFDTHGFGDLLSGIALLAISMPIVSVVWSVEKLFALAIFLLSGSLIIYSIFLAIATLAFWTTRIGPITEIVWITGNFTNYPLEIFNKYIKAFLTFIMPLAFVNYFPAAAILGKGIWPQLQYLSPLVAIISFAVAYSFWKFGLKHYSSTGS